MAAEAVLQEPGFCREVRTCWIPEAEVERVAPAPITGVELSMEALSLLADGADAKAKLGGFVDQYRAWITKQRGAAGLTTRRKDAAKELLDRADVAANRIEQGIAVAERLRLPGGVQDRQPSHGHGGQSRRAFITDKKDPATVTPKWRPFQLAFILMNLPGIADPTHADRRGRRSAVLPHRRRQDRGVPGAGGVHARHAAFA